MSPLCTSALPKESLFCCWDQGRYYPCCSTLPLWRARHRLSGVLCDKMEKGIDFSCIYRDVWNQSAPYSHHSLKILWGVRRGLWYFPCLLGFILWLDSLCTHQNFGLRDGKSSLLLKREQNWLIFSLSVLPSEYKQ